MFNFAQCSILVDADPPNLIGKVVWYTTDIKTYLTSLFRTARETLPDSHCVHLPWCLLDGETRKVVVEHAAAE